MGEVAAHFTWIDTVVLVVYFGSMAALGPIFASRAKTTEGYLLGDRSFPGWLIGVSMFATSISSITFMAYPADAYKTAWYRMTPNYMLPIVALVATFYFLPFFRRNLITTAYEYLEGRFGPYTRMYAAIAFIAMQVVRVSLILYLVSALLHEMLGLNEYMCVFLGGVITAFYTVLGGIRAVLWTDFIQGIVLFGGGLIAIAVVAGKLPGGLSQILSEAWADGKFSMSDLNDAGQLVPVQIWSLDFTEKTVLLFLLVGVGNWVVEYAANQNVIQRYAASKSAKQARIALWVSCGFAVPTWALFMFLGTCLYVFFKHFPTVEATAMMDGSAKAEGILPYFIITFLPQGLTGLVIAGVLSAAMSSLSSSINSVSAVSLVDVYRRHLVKDRDDRHYVIFAKLVGLAMGVVMIVGAIVLMASESKTLQDSATVLTAMTSGGLAGLYMLGFFTKVGDDRSVLTGILFMLTYTLWSVLTSLNWLPENLQSPIHGYYPGFIGHLVMFVTGYLFALLFPKRERDLHNLTVYTFDDTPMD